MIEKDKKTGENRGRNELGSKRVTTKTPKLLFPFLCGK
tara:strand:- start:213 stop:326 length:114 start_codon:yes stop_codon:yes gene_type:complete